MTKNDRCEVKIKRDLIGRIARVISERCNEEQLKQILRKRNIQLDINIFNK